MSAIRSVLGCRSNQWKECRLGPKSMRIAAELRAVDPSSSHQFEEEIGDSASENRLFIPKMEFSVRTAVDIRAGRNARSSLAAGHDTCVHTSNETEVR